MTTTNGAFTERWLAEVLAGLGHSADEVAAALRTAKITGVPGDCYNCPIARYITHRARRIAPSDTTVTASVSVDIWLGVTRPETGHRWVTAPRTKAVDAFIHAFDLEGAYPDLAPEPAA
jgi:hypothetical protein